jgi:hypothetical protein
MTRDAMAKISSAEKGRRMAVSIASTVDIDAVLTLQRRYHIDSIAAADRKNGFVTTQFTQAQLEDLVNREHGLVVGYVEDELVAYVMSASWQYWSQWPIFAYMIEHLYETEFAGQRLTVQNSYQYGPVCIDESVRGSGALEKIFHFARREMSRRYPILVTFINKINTRSFAAHTRKLGLQVTKEFGFNGNQYCELAIASDAPLP